MTRKLHQSTFCWDPGLGMLLLLSSNPRVLNIPLQRDSRDKTRLAKSETRKCRLEAEEIQRCAERMGTLR